MREDEGNCLKYLKRGTEKTVGGTKILKRWGKLGRGLKKEGGGAGTPLRTMLLQ